MWWVLWVGLGRGVLGGRGGVFHVFVGMDVGYAL